ncbi:hypothetical protein DXG01_011112 [Tephrocybe rancida]|nr:hypothetical protein DXG01_011112 [Tephrocybe rancida]
MVFVPECDAERMDHYASAISPPKKPQQTKRTRQEPEDLGPDHYEGGTAGRLRVPKSVLDDCEAGFTAADDRREKASTQFFDDTALMALYHQCLYTLDRQVQHARGDIIEKLGHWLVQRTRQALSKRTAAESMLASCGQSERFLRDEWALQVAAQTKPLPQQSRGRGKDAVQELIELRKGRDLLKEHVKDLEDALISGDSPELDRLEQSYRKQANEQKLNNHTSAAARTCEPTITRLALLYNQHCNTMKKMINERRAPRGARCPAKIEAKGLWALDVDDKIWQDIGLDEDITESQPPAWLCDERVHNGIKALLEHDRCLEEEKCLVHECRSMWVWFAEEWKIVNAAINGTDDEAILYHLELRRTSLCHLCALWQKSVNSLDSGDIESLPLWGPSSDEILAATVAEVTVSVNDDFDDEEFVHNPEDEADLELVDVMDTVALADSYRNHLVDDSDMLYDTLDF